MAPPKDLEGLSRMNLVQNNVFKTSSSVGGGGDGDDWATLSKQSVKFTAKDFVKQHLGDLADDYDVCNKLGEVSKHCVTFALKKKNSFYAFHLSGPHILIPFLSLF